MYEHNNIFSYFIISFPNFIISKYPTNNISFNRMPNSKHNYKQILPKVKKEEKNIYDLQKEEKNIYDLQKE